MKKPEFMRIKYQHIPDDIKQRYKLTEKVASDRFVYVKIKKGMYGLKQAAILAYVNLVENLKEAGYFPVPHTLTVWKHKTRRITFCVCVDDFGVKYYNKEDR